jgi:anti-sigma regulatory factor (Ser/Thr protein kinase)
MSGVEEVVSVELACDRQAPMKVRDLLTGLHDNRWSLDDGLLVASELVTNAVQHSGCSAGDRLSVEITRRPGTMRIAVHDPGRSALTAAPVQNDRFEPGGWGMRLIDRISKRWGSERPDGNWVWAELQVDDALAV